MCFLFICWFTLLSPSFLEKQMTYMLQKFKAYGLKVGFTYIYCKMIIAESLLNIHLLIQKPYKETKKKKREKVLLMIRTLRICLCSRLVDSIAISCLSGNWKTAPFVHIGAFFSFPYLLPHVTTCLIFFLYEFYSFYIFHM